MKTVIGFLIDLIIAVLSFICMGVSLAICVGGFLGGLLFLCPALNILMELGFGYFILDMLVVGICLAIAVIGYDWFLDFY